MNLFAACNLLSVVFSSPSVNLFCDNDLNYVFHVLKICKFQPFLWRYFRLHMLVTAMMVSKHVVSNIYTLLDLFLLFHFYFQYYKQKQILISLRPFLKQSLLLLRLILCMLPDIHAGGSPTSLLPVQVWNQLLHIPTIMKKVLIAMIRNTIYSWQGQNLKHSYLPTQQKQVKSDVFLFNQ